MHEIDKYKADHELYLRRENLQWEGSRMMLPEHVARILENNKNEKKVEKHTLDPDELQEIGYVVMDALNHTHEVVINYWRGGHYHKVIGFVAKVSPDQKKIRVESDGDNQYIDVDCLKSVFKLG